jgi:phosphatidylglycerophosphate synthase
MSNHKDEKYENDNCEAWSDANIFCPLGSLLVDPLYYAYFTPNMITILSTFCTILSIYFLHQKNNYIFVFLFLLGYLLDCVDGKLARRYNMGSNLGMALDLVSDNLSHIILLLYILLVKPLTPTNIIITIIVIILIYLLSLSYALNEAISCYDLYGNDNFYEKRENQLINSNNILFKLFLLINKLSYKSYKLVFPNYDIEKINKWRCILKHFGPGNYIILITIILLNI